MTGIEKYAKNARECISRLLRIPTPQWSQQDIELLEEISKNTDISDPSTENGSSNTTDICLTGLNEVLSKFKRKKPK